MPSIGKINKIIIILIGLFLLSPAASFAIDDGFGSAKKTAGRHFTVYYPAQLDIASLSEKLNIGSADSILAGKSSVSSSATGLGDMVDTLFTRVCDILDMQLYSYQGNIKVCRDAAQLNQIYRNLFGRDANKESFYIYDLNTVYISAGNFTREILGHEIAHAVISHYFVVLPSVKIQEVLAMYVEYQLRKSGQ